METLIKILVAINLWLWTSLFVISPSLRKAFVDMHCSMASDIYEAMKKQMVKLFRIASDFILRKLRKASTQLFFLFYPVTTAIQPSRINKTNLFLLRKNRQGFGFGILPACCSFVDG